MASITSVRSSNAAFTAPYRPVALFIGGTAGVGRGTAEAFARATKGNAHILICGRNKESAESTIASFPQTPQSKYEFIECDVSLMKNVVATTDSIKARLDTLNYLVVSQGIMTMQGFTPTAEGIDMKLSLHFYSRWKFVDELMPLLQKAKDQGQEARVLTVLHPSRGAPLDPNNLGLKKNYSLGLAAGQGITYNNLMVEEYSKRYPQFSFSHIYPGFVNTDLFRNLHWTVRPVIQLLAKAGTTLGDCGEYMLSALLNTKYRQGAFYLDNTAEPIPLNKVYTSDEARRIMVEHFQKETSV